MNQCRAIPIGEKDFVYGWYGEDKNGQAWIYHLTHASDKSSLMKFTDVIKETVGQATGLKDKNGVEIYENDRVLSDVGWMATIIYEKGSFGWIDIVGQWIPLCTWKDLNFIEVIGNVHQPELKDKNNVR